jgi:hypothetical protein
VRGGERTQLSSPRLMSSLMQLRTCDLAISRNHYRTVPVMTA